MIFKILVALTVLYFVLDAILARRGRRVFPFFKPKTVEHLIERRRQIEWILKCRDIPEEKRRIAQELVSSATAAIDDFRKKGHADLMATVAQVDGSFAKHLRPFKRNGFMEFIDSVWVVVLIALCIRFFLFESFRVPTGSMVPNIYIGDMLFVNKYIYGLRPPFTKFHFFRFKEPTRGEVVIFMYPENPSQDFVKRVVGLPGDRVKLQGKRVIVNGIEVQRERLGLFTYVESRGGEREAEWFIETNQDGVSYQVLYSQGSDIDHSGFLFDCKFCDSEFTVPDDALFVMGDNRDVSLDSRFWGFVPMENLKGRASMIWFSVSMQEGFHLDRMGEFIK
ncbi:MAG TPA: signal peptidase I [bacterium]|nr:signal peptidase I [bacterium]